MAPGAAGAQRHVPVLYHEVLAGLLPRAGGKYIDGTVGAGGHAAGLLSASGPDGRLLGLDRDPAALAAAAEVLAPFGARARLVHTSYTRIAVAAAGFAPVDGILLDLGLSSLQLEDRQRGFAFQAEGPLDMRLTRRPARRRLKLSTPGRWRNWPTLFFGTARTATATASREQLGKPGR